MVKQVEITAPLKRAVSVADLRAHTEVIDNTKDTRLGKLSDAAQDHAEERTYRKFVEQTWDQYVDTFSNPIVLKFPPTSSITSIKYTDMNGDEQTVSSAIYELGEVDGLQVARLQYNQLWPSDLRGHPDDIVVRTVNGYGSPDDVPEGIKHAIRMHVSWLNEFREGQIFFSGVHSNFPKSIDALLGPYRVRGY